MMRSLVIATLLASGMVLGAAAQTQPIATSKIAVVAFQVAVAQTNEGERNFSDLKKKYAPREAQLKAQDDEIQSLTKQLQATGTTLSEADRAGKARSIDDKKKKLQRDADDLRTQGGQEAQEMYSALASKVYDVLAGYAQQQGYTLVLDISQQQNPILFALPSTDITKSIVAAYNLKSGIPAPPAAPATAAGSAARPAAKPAPTAKAPAAH
jgi:outer membrane protein